MRKKNELLEYFCKLYKKNTGLQYIPSHARDLKILKDTKANRDDLNNYIEMWKEKQSSWNEKEREFWALPTLLLYRLKINEVKAYMPPIKPCYYKEL